MDRRLSLRHLAWQDAPAGKTPPGLGIALQAEHRSTAQKNVAPVLALFDGSALRPAQAPTSLAGYGGAICAIRDGWAVGCPRAQGVALFNRDGSWRELLALPHACAVAAMAGGLWAAGQNKALHARREAIAQSHAHRLDPQTVRLDNHWAFIAQSSSWARLPR